jgi:signal transduction histidine kinase
MAVTQALQDTQRREEQRHAAIALQRAKEEAEAANRLKSDFLAMMSHELRTPLHITVGYLDLLLEGAFGALTEEQRTPIQRIDSNVRRLLDLILATLDVTLLEAGQVLVELSEVHLEEFLPELQEEILQAQTKSGVSLQWQIAPGLPVLHTDRRKLKIVLANLLGNAQKFTSAGTITLVVFPQGEGVAFWVQDTGIGIGPEVLPHIFERFRQGESVRKRHYEGVGLGLYIVQLLLELLEGTITVKSVLGQGSTFRVWLPLRTSAELKTEPSSFQ